MPTFSFVAYEVDRSYYYEDAQSLILSKDKLKITDSVDDDLHRTQAEDPNNDQTFEFINESPVTDYTVQYLDFAQVNGSGPNFELYAMEVSFSDGATKYYVMSKDAGFDPAIGDDLSVTSFSNFTTTPYGQIGAAICFASGTQILTANGYVPVEQLARGSFVQTKDNGLKEVLWIGIRQLDRHDLRQAEALRPVLVRPHALGNPLPLLVSQQHRLLVSALHGFELGWNEGFIKAKHLAEYRPDMARIAHGKRDVIYYHLLLDAHEVIFANEAETESLLLGPMALTGISRNDRQTLRSMFPERFEPQVPGALLQPVAARPTASRRDLRRAFSKCYADAAS